MALTSYNDLVSSIATWLHRTDLTAVIPDFIALAEARMNSDLDIRQTGGITTLTTTGGVNTVVLPNDFKEMRSLSMVSGGVTVVLDNMPLGLMTQRWGVATSSMPRSFAIRGSDLVLAPTPDGAYDLTLDYFANIVGLSPTNLFNDVFINYPDMYLHACLIYGAQYVRDAEMVANMEQLYAADIARTNTQNWGQTSAMSMKQG